MTIEQGAYVERMVGITDYDAMFEDTVPPNAIQGILIIYCSRVTLFLKFRM